MTEFHGLKRECVWIRLNQNGIFENWLNKESWVSWKLKTDRSGEFKVEVVTGTCDMHVIAKAAIKSESEWTVNRWNGVGSISPNPRSSSQLLASSPSPRLVPVEKSPSLVKPPSIAKNCPTSPTPLSWIPRPPTVPFILQNGVSGSIPCPEYR